MYYKNEFLFFLGVSCSASFACQVYKWDWEGDRSGRMKVNSGSPLPATADSAEQEGKLRHREVSPNSGL